MNPTYLLALFAQREPEAAYRDAASRVAHDLVTDPVNDLQTASRFESVRSHQNFFRRLAGLPEFPAS